MLGNLFRIFICFAFAVICPVFAEEPADKASPDSSAEPQLKSSLEESQTSKQQILL